ncbi:transposase [Nonomuraea dietziae]
MRLAEVVTVHCKRRQPASRGTEHGSGLGKHRWIVEQTFALLHAFRRLRIRWEVRADIHEAFLKLACALVCWRRLTSLR